MSDAADILLVDDTPSNLNLLSEVLQQAGYRVRAATLGHIALQSALVLAPQLVLADVRMPGMDGFELCRRLKADPRTAQVPVIFVSAHNDAGERIRGLEVGGVDFIGKPFDRGEILARVRTHLSLRAAKLENDRLMHSLEQQVQQRTEELQQALEQLERLTEHMRDSVEQERLALASDMHDHIGASLTGARLLLGQFDTQATQIPFESRRLLQQISSLLTQALDSTRGAYTRLRPPMLDDLGLAETCRWYLAEWSQQTGIQAFEAVADLPGEPPEAVRMDLFRILQELLTNVARHSGASEVEVALARDATGLLLRVTDNGTGFDPMEQALGFGLQGIRGRLQRHQGELQLERSPLHMRVSVLIPAAAWGLAYSTSSRAAMVHSCAMLSTLSLVKSRSR